MSKFKKIMIWIGVIVILCVITGLLIGISVSAPKYRGPVTTHFNGSQFKNQSGASAKGFGDLIKWGINREPGKWEEVTNTEYGKMPLEKVNSLRITFVNHSTFLIQVDGVNILTDPIYSERTSPFQFTGPQRKRPPGIRFEDLPPIDYVIISHNHYDHLDKNTVIELKETHDPQFITPLGVAKYLNGLEISKTTDLDWWQSHQANDSLEIIAVPAQHFSGRGLLDRDATLWCGYIIKRPEGNVYFAGDTGYDKAMFDEIGQRAAPLVVSLIPIGAYKPEWFMSSIHTSPEDAVMAHMDLKSPKSVGIHFGTFPLADDGQFDPTNDLKKALEKQSLEPESFFVLKEGEGRDF